MTYETVVLATDGSRASEPATAHALGLAERYGAVLHVLSVVDVRAMSADDDGISVDDRILETLRDRCERAVAAVERRGAARDVEVVTEVDTGTPAGTIRRYAETVDADLVALGTRGRGGVARRLLGSVAGSVLAGTARPVLTARARRDERAATPTDTAYDDVLVPTDGSPAAERALDHALGVAERYGATLHALSVVNTGKVPTSQFLARLEEHSEQTLDAVAERARSAGVPVRRRVWRGTPAACVRGYAERHGVDLITMGTHGRRGVDRFLGRTVAERVVPTVDPPVLSVRAEDAVE